MQAPRAEVGLELARGESPRELAAAAPADLRTREASGQRAVEEHRQLQLVREQLGGDQRLGAGGAAAARIEVDDGRHVQRADVGVHAVVPGEVDAPQGLAGTLEQRLGQLALRAGERHDRAVVVGVGVDVEDARAAAGGEGARDRSDSGRVPALGHIGRRQQRHRSLPHATGGSRADRRWSRRAAHDR